MGGSTYAMLPPVTPGEILSEEFLADDGLPIGALAAELGIAPSQIDAIVRGRCPIGADLALRLALYFGNSPEFWMNLQSNCDLRRDRRARSPEVAARIAAHHAA
ncbi:MAG TPA: HigA family addiction module antitoxin [Thermomicrobiales bacterium]|nr:HigA family addiction module antitoxin [Thermomicrobiales bacterium]